MITPDDLSYFRQDLWKDSRGLSKTGLRDDEFGKYCFTNRTAALEAQALKLLEFASEEQLVPRFHRVCDEYVIMEKIEGIRLFDLLRYLKYIEIERRDGVADSVAKLLLRRSRDRLSQIQAVLSDNSQELAVSGRYPLGRKVAELLHLFISILDIKITSNRWKVQLESLSEYWENIEPTVPFRDATTKNTVVKLPWLSVQQNMSPVERHETLYTKLEQWSLSDWQQVPLIDFDFSSVEHLTTPEDDPISLHCHEWTYGSCPITPDNFVLLSDRFNADAYRCAATMFVRYLRFGGRKLAYKLLNSQGFEVRFEFDDPLFYFQNMSFICNALSKEFVEEYSDLFLLVGEIGDTVANFSVGDSAHLNVDQFRRMYGESASYWQENPIERANGEL